jgi:hypothetical protein
MKYIFCVKQSDGKVNYVGWSMKEKPSHRKKKGEQIILLDAVPNETTIKEVKARRDMWRTTLKCSNKEQT